MFGGGGGTAWPVDGPFVGNSKRPNFSLDRGALSTKDLAGTGGVAFDDPEGGGSVAEVPDDGSGRAASEAAGCVSFPLPEILRRTLRQMSLFDDIRFGDVSDESPSWLDERAGPGKKVRMVKSAAG